MTANQIAYANLQELKRRNLSVEGETHRHNVVTEGETRRHNVVTESIGWSQAAAAHTQASAAVSQAAAAHTQASAAVSQANTAQFRANTEAWTNAKNIGIAANNLDIRQYEAETDRTSMWLNFGTNAVSSIGKLALGFAK